MSMTRRLALLGTLAAVFQPATALAHEYYAKNFKLIHPWADASLPGARDATVYMSFEDVELADRLIGASSPFAARVELRSGAQESVDQRPPLAHIDIPTGQPVELARGQQYLLLRDLNFPLQLGRNCPLTLEFETSGTILVMVTIGGD